MKNRLSSWRSKQLSIGGRITMINSVLASLPLYYFSFFKAPKCVLKKMVQIQRNFLWGGNEEVRKIAWVSWKKICLPKTLGGLGVRNLEIFNVALLGKWKWRIMGEERSVWRDLLNELYGDNGILSFKQRSTWWKDLISLDGCLPFAQQWFADCVKCKLGDGKRLRFWIDSWCCQWSLSELFPQLYEATDNPIGRVADFGEWLNREWRWRLQWRRDLSFEEQQAVELLLNMLKPIHPADNGCDKLVWTMDNSVYKVKSVYKLLLQKSGEIEANDDLVTTLKVIWKAKVPSKVLVHVWRTLLRRIPTKYVLIQRRVILQNGGPKTVATIWRTLITCSSSAAWRSSCGIVFAAGRVFLVHSAAP